MKDPSARKGTVSVDGKSFESAACVTDNSGQTPLHLAAVGGHWNVLYHLHFIEKAPFTVDNQGCTVSDCAARPGKIWFLKRLSMIEAGEILMKALDKNQCTILFDAAHLFDSNVLIMLAEEFGIDPKLQDSEGNTVLHYLAKLAEEDPVYWDTLTAIIAWYSDKSLLNIPNKKVPPKTVREFIIEGGEIVNFPESLTDLLSEDNIEIVLE